MYDVEDLNLTAWFSVLQSSLACPSTGGNFCAVNWISSCIFFLSFAVFRAKSTCLSNSSCTTSKFVLASALWNVFQYYSCVYELCGLETYWRGMGFFLDFVCLFTSNDFNIICQCLLMIWWFLVFAKCVRERIVYVWPVHGYFHLSGVHLTTGVFYRV